MSWVVMVCALLAGGCAGMGASDRRAAAIARVTAQTAQLDAAATHLNVASQRLSKEADPQHAADELAAGAAQVQLARTATKAISLDISELGGQAVSLQAQIDAHQNDLLGPRGKRIRNRVIIVAVVAAIGWSLLQLGPVFGGPIGGAVLVAGHVLTAFVVPVFGLLTKFLGVAWGWIAAGGKWAIGALDRLGTTKKTGVSAVVPSPAQS
jgi:hypothetical protein